MSMENDPHKEAYWKERHGEQPFVDKEHSYEDYAHAYRTGFETVQKHRGKNWDEIEEEVALGYEKSQPDDALPWDHVRPVVKTMWDRLSGVAGPRDVDRGMRTGM